MWVQRVHQLRTTGINNNSNSNSSIVIVTLLQSMCKQQDKTTAITNNLNSKDIKSNLLCAYIYVWELCGTIASCNYIFQFILYCFGFNIHKQCCDKEQVEPSVTAGVGCNCWNADQLAAPPPAAPDPLSFSPSVPQPPRPTPASSSGSLSPR